MTIQIVKGAGKVLQVVNYQTGALATGTTTIPQDDSIPQNTEGDEYMTLSITPKKSTSRLKIDVVVNGIAGNSYLMAALFKDDVADAIAAAYTVKYLASYIGNVAFTHYMTSGTINLITFKVRAGDASAGTFTFNGHSAARKLGGVLASSITITEIDI